MDGKLNPFIIYFNIKRWNTLIALILPFLTISPEQYRESELNRISDIYYFLSINLVQFQVSSVVPYHYFSPLQPVQIFGRKWPYQAIRKPSLWLS